MMPLWSFLLGALAALLFLGLLHFSLRRARVSRNPWPVFYGCWLLRMALAVTLFYLLLKISGPTALIFSLFGFMITRMLVVNRISLRRVF